MNDFHSLKLGGGAHQLQNWGGGQVVPNAPSPPPRFPRPCKTALIERTAQDFNIFFQIDTQKQSSSPRNHVLETDTVEKENYAKLFVTYKMTIQISAET